MDGTQLGTLREPICYLSRRGALRQRLLDGSLRVRLLSLLFNQRILHSRGIEPTDRLWRSQHFLQSRRLRFGEGQARRMSHDGITRNKFIKAHMYI